MIVITGASDGLGHELAKVFKQAGCVKQLLDLPKGIEVSNIVLNRKKGFKG